MTHFLECGPATAGPLLRIARPRSLKLSLFTIQVTNSARLDSSSLRTSAEPLRFCVSLFSSLPPHFALATHSPRSAFRCYHGSFRWAQHGIPQCRGGHE